MNQIDKIAEQIAGRVKSDWQNAYAIACAVKKGAGNGGDPATRHLRTSASGKVSAEEMARRVRSAAKGSVYGMGRDAILSALEKWNEVAPQYGLPGSDFLIPEDVDNEPTFPDRAWKDEGTGSKVKDILSNPKATAAAMADKDFRDKVRTNADKKTNEAVAEEAIKTAPQLVIKAITEDEDLAEALAEDHDAVASVYRAIAKTGPIVDIHINHPDPEPFNIMIGMATVSHAVEVLIEGSIDQHPEGFGDSGEGHAKDAMRVVATLSAFADWLKDPSVPFHDPSAERFDITEGELYVHDIVGHRQ